MHHTDGAQQATGPGPESTTMSFASFQIAVVLTVLLLQVGVFQETEAVQGLPTSPNSCNQVRKISDMSARVAGMNLLEGWERGDGGTLSWLSSSFIYMAE